MVVGMGEDPTLGEYERLLLSMKTTARKELVLLHPDRSVIPGSTREWLKVSEIIECLDILVNMIFRIVHGYINISTLSYLYVDTQL